MKARVTIADVADLAGVSTQTVSRVLNHKPDVAPETRHRIWQVIQELDYEPNWLARSLVSKKTQSLGLITEDFSDPFFAQVVAGAETEARNQGYFLLICSLERPTADDPQYLRLITSRQVDGVLLLTSAPLEARHISALLDQGTPIVAMGFKPDIRLPSVDIDNIEGGYQATRCLIEHGFQRIGIITGPTHSGSAMNRLAGYQKALQEAGIALDERLIINGDWSYESGYQATLQLLEIQPRIEAIFAGNDRMAIATIRALQENALKVPDDVSLVGYDDIPAAAYSFPPLTTICQPAHEIGKTAIRMLLDLIDKPGSEPQRVLIKPELVKRASCRRQKEVFDSSQENVLNTPLASLVSLTKSE